MDPYSLIEGCFIFFWGGGGGGGGGGEWNGINGMMIIRQAIMLLSQLPPCVASNNAHAL